MARIGRNDPCPCGSGRKYKKCCTPKFDAPPPLPATSKTDEKVGGSRWLSNVDDSSDSALFAAAHGALVRAWEPVPEVWAVTGVGVAAVARVNAEGAWAYAGFGLELMDRGIKAAFGKAGVTETETEDFIDSIRVSTGPTRLGDASRAATLVGACQRYNDAVGGGLPAAVRPFTAMMPRVEARSLDALAGPGGLHPRALVEMARAHAHMTDVRDGAEVAILTSAEFVVDGFAALSALRAQAPDFDLIEEGTRTTFEFTRPSRPGQRAPLSRIEGRRVQGKAIVEGDRMTVVAGTLSMMALLLEQMLDAVTPRPRLRAVTWYSPTLVRSWAWRALDEPLAMHDVATVEG